MKKGIQKLLTRVFGPDRILLPTILFVSCLSPLLFLLWKFDLLPGGYRPPFLFCAAVAALVGYYLARTKTSERGLLFGGGLSVVAFTIYYYELSAVESVPLWVLVGLVFLCALTFGPFSTSFGWPSTLD